MPVNSRSSSKLGTCEAGKSISKTGGGCRVRRWKARTIIRDEDGNLLRKVEQICERWGRYLTSLLNTTSATLDRIIEGLAPKSVALSHGDPPNMDATKDALRTMAYGKAMGSNEVPVELRKFGLFDSSHEILLAFHIIVAVWMTGEVSQGGNTPP